LPYPGGPEISRLAAQNREEEPVSVLHNRLPRPMQHHKDLDLSFSGLKTAVRYLLRDMTEAPTPLETRRIAREFEDAVTDVLTSKVLRALATYKKVRACVIGGGVSANTHIGATMRENIQKEAQECALYIPAAPLHTDNAIMIGMAAFLCHLRGEQTYTHKTLPPAQGSLRLLTAAPPSKTVLSWLKRLKNFQK
jgi:N6-L-threonylcarbamoyladenine synthase